MELINLKNCNVKEIKNYLKEGWKIIDVRENDEIKEISLNVPFIHIPLQKVLMGAYNLEKNDNYLVICRSGVRSQKACYALQQHGFKNVINVSGGILEYQSLK